MSHKWRMIAGIVFMIALWVFIALFILAGIGGGSFGLFP